ncbi:LPS export ABC transporter periplasmic protein LptC [Pseudoalteromonas sp. McH1-7]|uniref:LPS export ABC transporter periplasmic protein LptC n=1 Tax=Pseudoalteromonas TaxID=53246 RepID=UPI00158FFC64|nr:MULTISPECIES: LPS export ABC transporter periplasmic protein LptC [Pseudoalteromonas]MDW7550478.1 LPS export ABC transporter periplasmic protein LptC [Pseudoalteromonas peptidolytica]NUZ11807.1 LPS export ABC transporter periplasmic protein LptC [Pseudoalteromonas sp. McH1-7]USD28273.1 LPS export ABC transporter periplasmic protein LptC [Pseudoalteromonas sp. SCSIO 43201]
MTVLRVILLITFSALMIWLWSPMFNASEINKKSDDEPLAKPDYVATALEQTTYSENGLLNYHVTADKMELYQDLGFSHFAKPIFTLYNGEQNWQISALEATLYENNTLILEGDVLAKNLTPDAMISTINADNVRVEIKQKLMKSEHPVIITGPSLKITGKGLHADLQKQLIELINHTKTIYYDQ